MEKYFTFVCTLSIPTLDTLPFFVISSFLSFLHNPAHRQPFSPIHHRLHPFRHHPSLALFSPAPPITTGSMSSMPLSILKFDFSFSWLFFVVLHFSFFFFLWRHCQSCLVGFLEIELRWSLILVGRRWIWWLRLDSFWVDGFWVSIVWRISGTVWVSERLDGSRMLVAWWTVWVGCFSWVLIFHFGGRFQLFLMGWLW